MKQKSISATEFDRIFDEVEDIWDYLDHSKIRRPNLEPKRVNVDFPLWMVKRLDSESNRLGVTRQSLIKTWIGDRLKEEEDRQRET